MVSSLVQRARDQLHRFDSVYLWWALIVVGIILRLRQYTVNRSLWADEASLAYNLANRGFLQLTTPLDYEQGAPIGFLFIEKVLVVVLGNIDQVMRLFPLFSGITALCLCYRFARTYIKGGMLALLLMSISWPLIYYSSELKQYSSDVMIALWMIFLGSRCLEERRSSKDFLRIGIAGAIAIWVSHPAAFILAGIGLALFFSWLSPKQSMPLLWLVGIGAAWAASFAVEYFVSLRHLVADQYLHSYWQKAFMPLPPGGTRIWLAKTYYSFLSTSISRTNQALVWGIPILSAIGFLSMLQRRVGIAVMLGAPFVLALTASALEKYPLKDRFMLFLAPLMLLLVAEGLGRFYSSLATRHVSFARLIYTVPAGILLLLPAQITWDYFISPYTWSDIKPVLTYVANHYRQEDLIYVYHGADPAFHYYAPLYGLNSSDAMVGYDTPAKRLAFQEFVDNVETLRGRKRVWFLFSDIVDCGGRGGDMQLFYANYLNERGIMLDNIQAAGASAYLYDLYP